MQQTKCKPKRMQEQIKKMMHDMPKIQEIRFIGVEFDYRKVKIGEDLVNKAISQGFQPLRDYETNSGLVVIMAKWENDDDSCKE
ncbi:MAG: hypothetical protein CL763_08045 [Chloroflexi bacterium]|nr:hypothetical protein [Chloroflexota bacterium]|tara:strand:+ start:5476 stop:5727 length:252 start_codon:yes stop_codon:yes gene_type:complete